MVGQDDKPVSESFRDPELLPIVCTEQLTDPLTEGRRTLPNIDRDVEHGAGYDAHELPLGLFDLIVQSSQHMFGGTRMVVLNEGRFPPDRFLEGAPVEAFEKESSFVSEDTRFQQDDVGYGERDDFHVDLWGSEG